MHRNLKAILNNVVESMEITPRSPEATTGLRRAGRRPGWLEPTRMYARACPDFPHFPPFTRRSTGGSGFGCGVSVGERLDDRGGLASLEREVCFAPTARGIGHSSRGVISFLALAESLFLGCLCALGNAGRSQPALIVCALARPNGRLVLALVGLPASCLLISGCSRRGGACI